MAKFVIIGGQYNVIKYGTSNTLHGAKLIAQKHWEYWDNWRGWHVPEIYKEGEEKTIGKFHEVEPVASYDIKRKRWVHRDW